MEFHEEQALVNCFHLLLLQQDPFSRTALEGETIVQITRGYRTELNLNNKQITACKKHAGAARKAEIAASLPAPKAKVKPRKGKQTRSSETPTLPEQVARKVKKKQITHQLRQATSANAHVRPAVVVLEDLHVDGMKRNRKLALSISDVGLGEFRRQMGYKTVWQGETLLLADRWFPSTKRCSRCGNVKEEMELSERIYVCAHPACGLVIDRDLNAALNLAALASPTKSLPGVPREG